ncbi:hypothetical protein UB46_18385 [Burkholderiaceae bacterium 16]|nr:hypothetical protein UB46_18385 [Burkholderiaceae bacterium 16]
MRVGRRGRTVVPCAAHRGGRGYGKGRRTPPFGGQTSGGGKCRCQADLTAAVASPRLPAGAGTALLAARVVALRVAIGWAAALIIALLGGQGATVKAVISAGTGFHSFDLGTHMVLPFGAYASHLPAALAASVTIARSPAFGPAVLPKRDLRMADSVEAEH